MNFGIGCTRGCESDASSSLPIFFISGGRSVRVSWAGCLNSVGARQIKPGSGLGTRPLVYRKYILTRRDGFLCYLSDSNPTSRLLHCTTSRNRVWPT